MTPSILRGIGLASLIVAAAIAFGCQSIVGIEDRTLDTCDEKCETCQEYCATVKANCTGENTLYRTDETCLGLCNQLPLGDLKEPASVKNSIACRLDLAQAAASSEAQQNCTGASSGGGNLCGSDCESYCYLRAEICGSEFTDDDENKTCIDRCRAFEDEPVFDVNGYYDTDSVECRLIHLANSTTDPEHCGHAAFQSTLHCFPPKKDTAGNIIPPDCGDYCRVAMVACQDDLKTYDDTATCLATCAALTPGTNEDQEENTVGCRHYHSYNAITKPGQHCSHTGPGGAGHCGVREDGVGNCESYCQLANAGCPTAFAVKYPNGESQCRTDCADFPGAGDNPDTTDMNETEQYSVELGERDDPAFVFQCRILHTTRALLAGNEPVAECNAVFGVSACH